MFPGSRNCLQSRMHCCYIIPSTEFKLSCLLCNHQFRGLKKKTFYATKTKECRGKNFFLKLVLSSSLRVPDPYLLLENPRHLSQGFPDFLSTCLETDSPIPHFSFRRILLPRERSIVFTP